MTEKQTICPNCASTYKVTVTQLTVAQGMVCCPKCNHNFNALLHLQQVSPPEIDLYDLSLVGEAEYPLTIDHLNEESIFDIFKRKAENSNIDLKTYLNNLNYFNNEPVNNIPSLNLSLGLNNQNKNDLNPRSKLYYVVWSLINIALLSVLLFQIVWFNPKLIDQHPLISSVFTKTCSLLRCETIDQRYKKVIISDVQIKSERVRTQFTGQINNRYSKSLELPIIKLQLKAKGIVVQTYMITSHEYLIDSLQGIKRIPQNSPYPFKFMIELPRNSFDQYELMIIHP